MVVSIIFNVLLGSLTAYCLERFQFRFKRDLHAVLSGHDGAHQYRGDRPFQVIRGLGLYNTLGAPIIIYITANLMQLYITASLSAEYRYHWMKVL